jgi:hypothetical protein
MTQRIVNSSFGKLHNCFEYKYNEIKALVFLVLAKKFFHNKLASNFNLIWRHRFYTLICLLLYVWH